MSSRKIVDVCGFCETFLTDSISDDMIKIHNYIFERKDRQLKKGGGILVYIKENILYIRRKDLESESIEAIWIEICFCKTKSFLMCFIYRPPYIKLE